MYKATPLVRVRAKKPLKVTLNGLRTDVKVGDEFETHAEHAKALGDLVEPVTATKPKTDK